MTGYNFKKKDSGLNLIKEIIAKKHNRQKEQEIINKLSNPYTQKNRPK
jgi:hypothetical protein